MTDKYKTFELFGSGLTGAWSVRKSNDAGDDDVYIKVIETKAVEDLQAKLDEAVVLLKEVSESRIADCQTANDTRLKYEIDDFLKGVEG